MKTWNTKNINSSYIIEQVGSYHWLPYAVNTSGANSNVRATTFELRVCYVLCVNEFIFYRKVKVVHSPQANNK